MFILKGTTLFIVAKGGLVALSNELHEHHFFNTRGSVEDVLSNCAGSVWGACVMQHRCFDVMFGSPIIYELDN